LGEKAQLEYSTVRPKRGRRWLTWAVVVAALGIGADLLYQKLVDPVMQLRWQHQCMVYSLPSSSVVYEEDHAVATGLANGLPSGPDWTTLSDQAPSRQILAYYAEVPPCLRAFVYQRRWGPIPIARRNFDLSAPALFLHGRQAKGMDARLIYVRVNNFFSLRGTTDDTTANRNNLPALDWIVIKPQGLTSDPTILAHGEWRDPVFVYQMPKPLRMYAGQADPADDSHFTIRFHLPQGEGKIDGWLLQTDQLNLQATMPNGHVSP
jgi:hypothetical protein